MTTTPRRQQQQTNKGFMNKRIPSTRAFSHWFTFSVSGPVYYTVSGQICRSPKSPLTKQIITCKVFAAPCEEQRYTVVNSLFLF